MQKRTIIILLLVCNLFTVFGQLVALKPLLDAQINNTEINIPKGTYLMDTQNGGGYTFNNLTNVTINLNGSQIICNKASNVFTLNNCSNVTIKGFSVDFDPLLFTQGIITAVDSSKKWFEFIIDSGYPLTNIETSRTQFFNPLTRELKRNSLTVYDGSMTISAISGTTNKFRATKLYTWDALESVGDLVVLSCSGTGHAFYMYRCQNMNVEDVVLYGAPSFAFFENETNNSHYLRCKVTLNRDDLVRSSIRLRSSNADGLHSKNASKGPTIENCEITYGGDDCIAINGAMYPIYAVDVVNRTISLLSTSTSSYLTAGDTAQLVSYAGQKLGVAKMEITRSVTPSSTDISTFLAKYSSLQSNTNYTYGIQIRLSSVPAGLAVGDVVYSRDKTGQGFVIKNNVIGHIRSRGVLLKSSNGTVTGNTISDCEMAGIQVAPEYDWMEAGFSSNLEISNNTITNCMFGRSSTGGKAGALSVMCVGANSTIAPLGAYSKINIHDNIINSCPRPCVVITSVDKLKYNNNSISADISTIRVNGQDFGVPNNVDLWTKNITYDNLTEVSTIQDKKNKVYISDGKICGLEQFIGGTLLIHSLDGSLILQKPLNSDSIKLNLNNKNHGIYILSLKTGTQNKSFKITL